MTAGPHLSDAAALAHADCTGADFSHANLHGLADHAARWDGARKTGARATDPALAHAERWTAPQR
ncbi:type VI secretion system [Burkholderia pseudomallei]|nr:type VI secretion system [Burkholderia pseudomallei]